MYNLWKTRIEKRHNSPKRSESPVSWNHERAYATPRTPQAEENAEKTAIFSVTPTAKNGGRSGAGARRRTPAQAGGNLGGPSPLVLKFWVP